MASMLRLGNYYHEAHDIEIEDSSSTFDTGIEVEYGPAWITNSEIRSFGSYGIYADGNLAWVNIADNRILNCSTGIYLFNAVSIAVVNNWIAGYSTQGILDTASGLHTRIIGNYLERTSGADYGMRIYGDSYVVEGNVMRYTHDIVDFDIQGDANTIVGNKGYDCQVSGDENLLTGNYFTSDITVNSGAADNRIGINYLIDINDSGTGTRVELLVKSDTGDPTAHEGLMYVNLADNKLRVYADGAWRDVVTW